MSSHRNVLAILALALAMTGLYACGKSAEERTPPLRFESQFIEKAEPTRVTIVWTTSVPTEGEILYGADSANLAHAVPARAVTTIHRTTIEGLEPGATYFYRVRARTSAGKEATDRVRQFTTPLVAEKPVEDDGGYDVAVIETDYGQIVFRFLEEYAPRHSANFKKLAREGFYDGTTFHRVIPGFIIQGGDPLSRDNDRSNDGTGGPGYTLPPEIHATHVRGAVAAARKPDAVNPRRYSNGSQFYICVGPAHFLDGKYTVFGQVIKGLDVANEIANVPRDDRDNPRRPVVMRRVTIRHIKPGEVP